MNVANGCYGTKVHDRETIIKIRRQEGINAAKMLGAKYHESICEDMHIAYDYPTIYKLTSTIRQCQPDIILTQDVNEYHMDHTNAAKVTVTAAFAKGMPRWPCDPPIKDYDGDVTIYHALPHGLCTPYRQKVKAS